MGLGTWLRHWCLECTSVSRNPDVRRRELQQAPRKWHFYQPKITWKLYPDIVQHSETFYLQQLYKRTWFFQRSISNLSIYHWTDSWSLSFLLVFSNLGVWFSSSLYWPCPFPSKYAIKTSLAILTVLSHDLLIHFTSLCPPVGYPVLIPCLNNSLTHTAEPVNRSISLSFLINQDNSTTNFH